MSAERWARFCVVGVGHHARTKLIPAIQANGQSLIGVVSRRAQCDEGAPRFANVEDAVAALPSDTAFMIASPPPVHFSQAMPALRAGRDVILEKPAFVAAAEAEAAAQAAESTGALLVEGFMNRHTATHRLFLDAWSGAEQPRVVEAVFTIPAAPAGTFRSSLEIGASNLYDVASYLLAALLDAGAALDEVNLDRVDHAGLPEMERLHMSGRVNGASFSAVSGIAERYENSMRLVDANGAVVTFTPFIYGRPGPRRMIRRQGDSERETVVDDVNAFEAMLATPLEEWRETAAPRTQRMIDLTRNLERLGRALSDFRAAAG